MNAQDKQRQMAWVVDLNKCIGCQTCSVACKVLWTRDDSEKAQWWCSVNTQPGEGTPRGWENMGGGYTDKAPAVGQQPTPADFGGGFEFNINGIVAGQCVGHKHIQVAGKSICGIPGQIV